MDFQGKVIVLTGTPRGQRSRQAIVQELIALGAIIEERITLRTDILVYGRTNTTKYKDAKSKGVRLMDYDGLFREMRNAPLSLSQDDSDGDIAEKRYEDELVEQKLNQFRVDLLEADTGAVSW